MKSNFYQIFLLSLLILISDKSQADCKSWWSAKDKVRHCLYFNTFERDVSVIKLDDMINYEEAVVDNLPKYVPLPEELLEDDSDEGPVPQ
ncbi:MAG: hypothetical protein RLZZ230_739 [Candidatus Parcubacteria bacterium]|jgi:hypothetical protein